MKARRRRRNGPCGFPRRSRTLAGMAATSMAFEREASFMLENTPVQKSARNESRSRRLRAIPPAVITGIHRVRSRVVVGVHAGTVIAVGALVAIGVPIVAVGMP